MKAKCRPVQGKWHEMNRKQRRETMRKIQSDDLSLEVVHHRAQVLAPNSDEGYRRLGGAYMDEHQEQL